MSKTHKQQPASTQTPQALISRLRMSEAKQDIREALKACQEATNGR